MSIIQRFKDFVNKETNRENESHKVTVLIRVLSLALTLTSLVSAVVYLISGFYHGAFMLVFGSLTYCAVFTLTYFFDNRCTLSLFITIEGAIFILTPVVFGWDSSVQAFPILLVIIYFFSSYKGPVYKFSFIAATFIVYMILSMKFGGTTGVMDLSPALHVYIRDANMFIVLVLTGIAAYMFANEKQDMEKKLIEYNKKLEEKASVDPLTGLFNRRKCMEYLEELEKKASEHMFCIVMGDIDHFKNVNDTYGHDTGDLVLQGVAKVFTTCTRDIGLVSRWGGEEFLIVLPDMNGDEAMEVLFNIQSEMRKMCVMSGDQKIKVTLTYGLTEYDPALTLDQNIKDADDKLYLGKQQGRDTVIF